MSASLATPEFLVWAVEHSCPLRGDEDGSDPQRVERQLRAVRAVSDARREGRVLEGLCVAPPDGFRIDDALAVFGGEAAVERACHGCPANAEAQQDAGTWAGCYGMLALPDNPADFHAAVERCIQQSGHLAEIFSQTRPRWYGLWMKSPLKNELLLSLSQVLKAVHVESREWEQLLLAIDTAKDRRSRLHVRLYPPGRVEGPWWRIAAHCPQCHAPRTAERSTLCPVCGHVGHATPEQKRHARGRRPYFPLERLLGSQPAAEFLVRYEAQRRQPEPPDRA